MPGQSGPGSNGNEGVLCIPQIPSITGTPPSDCLMLYLGHSLGGGVLPLCRDAVSVFYSPSRPGNQWPGRIWVQSQVESYQRFKKWYLMPPCLILSIIRYGSRVKWVSLEKGVAPSPIPRCSSYRKVSLQVTLVGLEA